MANELKTVRNVETDQVARAMLIFLNQWADKPVSLINFEFLDSDADSMCMSEIQGAYKTKQYIDGGYEAQYQFKIVYRVAPLNSVDKRLKAIELLNALSDWAVYTADAPPLGDGIQFKKLTTNSRASMFGRYENGYEDYQVLMTMTYEVNVNG